MSDRVARNRIVTITYRIADQSGTTVEQNDVPISYLHGGHSDLIPKVEQSLDGHVAGDRVEVVLSPEEGFGQPDPGMVYTDRIDNVPPAYREIGAQAEFQNERGERQMFVVTRIDDGKITLDGNHPLAGQTVKFMVDIVAVRDATDDEIKRGGPENPYGFEHIEPGSAQRH